jgi:hypothetical protein
MTNLRFMGTPTMRRHLTRLLLFACLLFRPEIPSAVAAEAPSLSGRIDRQIEARLAEEKVPAVPAADDAEFLRRVYLDLHGVVPTAEQAAAFLARNDSGKRAELIDQLLDDPRFGEHFGDRWRKSLISPVADERRLQTERFAAWLARRFNDNDGWDRIVFDLVTATGKMEDNPAVTYLIEGRHPLGVTDLADLSSRYFLGVRLNCAQCHDHPFVSWKRHDYWGMAAFFAQIQTPHRPKMVYMAGLQDDPKMNMGVLRDADLIEGFQSEVPTFLGGETPKAKKGEPLRVSLARWMTAPENPFFARATVNRLWWHFFGRGIVTPVDDMHSANAPSHPELLDLLTREFTETKFDVKHFCRAVLNSRAYQRTSRPGTSADRRSADREAELFARMSIKVLTAEQLYDSLIAILGSPAKTPAVDTRLGPREEFTRYFASSGDPEPTRYDRGIPHLLRLMNSPQFAGRNVAALVTGTASSGDKTDKLVDDLFLTILARYPTGAERELVQEQFDSADTSAEQAARELAWALLMSGEFSLNH